MPQNDTLNLVKFDAEEERLISIIATNLDGLLSVYYCEEEDINRLVYKVSVLGKDLMLVKEGSNPIIYKLFYITSDSKVREIYKTGNIPNVFRFLCNCVIDFSLASYLKIVMQDCGNSSNCVDN